MLLFSPAKINVALVVLRRRADGFHDIWSCVAPLHFGDHIDFTPSGRRDRLECNHPDVPLDDSNLILKALRLFREHCPCPPLRVVLTKRIPIRSGLGGGSGNGTTFLRGLNAFFGNPLSDLKIATLAAQLGSDGPLFCNDGPSIVSGRGEIVLPAAERLHRLLSGRRILIVKPPFGVDTSWAYSELATQRAYGSERTITEFKALLNNGKICPFNSMETIVFNRLPLLRTLRDTLAERFNLSAHMSGSGSSLWSFLDDRPVTDELVEYLHEHIGPNMFFVETFIK
jgi:4-diphosphocytidyl-2-C-methyl-D-erythritol kinase